MDHHSSEPLLLPFEDAGLGRRGFLQLVGFGITGATLTGCSRGPVQNALAALNPTPEIVPGRAYSIASTCGACEAGCGVLVKCRDGRPIKLEGNPAHPLSRGGLCAAGQASILGLYDSRRIDGPLHAGVSTTWESADRELGGAFDALRERGGRVRVLTGTLHSPSTLAAIRRFLAGFSDGRHVVYDSLSVSARLDAYELTHGVRLLPRPRLERARTIVSFDADFLGTWTSPVEYTVGYTAGRVLEGDHPRLSKHVQFEARTSLTGCRADQRVRLAPWETEATLAALGDLLEQRAGTSRRLAGAAEGHDRAELLETIAEDLWSTRGESLVLAGANELGVQVLAAYANHLLGSHGTTLDLERPSHQKAGNDGALAELREELAADAVDALVVARANPGYDLAGELAIDRAGLFVSCSGEPDETTALADWVCPEPHELEAWNDGEPVAGTYTLTQPTVPALRSARTLRESLSRWHGDGGTDLELVRGHWSQEIFPRQSQEANFDSFFDAALHEGFVTVEVPIEIPGETSTEFRTDVVSAPTAAAPRTAGELALVLYAKPSMLDGRHAHNPWLHELPDPVSKVTWDNYASLSSATARRLGVEEGDVLRIAARDGEASLELPAHVQHGQHDGVVAVALGYGRSGTDRFSEVGPQWLEGRPTVLPGETIGASAAAFVGLSGGARSYAGRAVTVERTGASRRLAATQDHHSLTVPEHLAIAGHEVRDAARATSFAEWREDPAGVHHAHHGAGGDLWPEDHAGEVRWGLAVDLARCTGCSACVIGCQAENNVPVVGKDEVQRHREMSWLRIDRYYQGDGDDLRTIHQPMMCQQCDHAPCESVCPVLATVHSDEGLNQQVYNRCVGTRYCANTCPYKVRRFNWFDYRHEDRLQNHTLNPDVTVRTRGVMEKCTFCVQRIQEAKAEAKREGRALRDGDIQSACQQSCPANAIVFGDLADPESRVARLGSAPRAYAALEELNVQPSVRYLAHVFNGTPAEGGHDH